MIDLAQLIRDEIEEQEISPYRVSVDVGIDQTNLGRFLKKERDMYLATASKLFDYLGLTVVKENGKHKKARR